MLQVEAPARLSPPGAWSRPSGGLHVEQITCSHTPLLHFTDIDDLHAHLPFSAPLVGVELDPRAVTLGRFQHPERAVYLLGAEDHGLTPDERDRCHHLVQIESLLPESMNVATAGTLLMYARHMQSLRVSV